MARSYSPWVPFSTFCASYLKANYLTGLTICGADGQELPDDYYDNQIDNAVAKIEDLINIDIATRVNLAEHHDYRVTDYSNYGFLQLFRTPVQSVQEVRAVYPTGQTIQVFPPEWIRLEQRHAQIHLVPTAGTLSQVVLGNGADYLPLIYGGLGYLPFLWEVDYTTGFTAECSPGMTTGAGSTQLSDSEITSGVPRMIADAVMKFAAIEILQIASDTVLPLGISSQSLGVDGLSQSRSFNQPAFKNRIDRYSQDLGAPLGQGPGILGQIRNNWFGVNLSSL